MKSLIICIVFLLSVPFTCTRKENDQPVTDSGLRIVAGYACGWGSGEDSLIITSSLVKYNYTVPASSAKPRITVSRTITSSEWQAVQEAVNYNSFIRLNYNSCNICVDGCDEWIIIYQDDFSHEIRYSKGQQITEIASLQSILLNYRKEFGSPGW